MVAFMLIFFFFIQKVFCSLIREHKAFKMTVHLIQIFSFFQRLVHHNIYSGCTFQCAKPTGACVNDITLEWDGLSCQQELHPCIQFLFFFSLWSKNYLAK